jgi:hypothetical protein
MAELRAAQKALKGAPADGVAPPLCAVYLACVSALTGWPAPDWLDLQQIVSILI